MKLQEEKAAEVRARWEEIQKEKKIRTFREVVNDLKNSNTKPAVKDTRPALTSGAIKEMTKKITDMVPPKSGELSSDDKAKYEAIQKKDHDEAIADLKTPIEWYGKIAVGESRSFPGWWNVVPPTGSKVSYLGPEGRDRARAQARMMQSWYD